MVSSHKLLAPGHNCWRIARCDRLGFLVDGQAYFQALREALIGARHSVLIISWDINSRFRLIRAPDDDGWPAELGPFLERLVQENERLNIHILNWDFALLFALDREWLPGYKLGSKAEPRIHYRFDDRHPVGGSQHQKMVVVDGRLAFLGGLDITMGRWDTSEHRPEDPRRRDLGRTVPQPYHDVQAVLTGEAARAIDELARGRWRQATGQHLAATGDETTPAPWPASAAVHLENIDIGIARTRPEYGGDKPVHEIEHLIIDTIEAARRYIYIENQYFTAGRIIEALAEKLASADGPEIVAVLPEHTNGWLSRGTMDVLREKQIGRLHEADRYDRFRVYYPHIPGLGEECVNVHAKVTIVDDRLLRVGSANLNNRSLGLDSECDIAVDAGVQPEAAEGVMWLRNRLLAEHLDTRIETVDRAMREHRSLIGAIESLRTDGRSLRPVPASVNPELVELIPESQLLDPEQPLDAEHLLEEFVPKAERFGVLKRALPIAAVLAVLAGLTALWRWTPLSRTTDIDKLISMIGSIETLPAAPAITVAGITVAATLGVPVTVLILATLLVFGPVAGFAYSLAGALLSAVIVYGIGRKAGGGMVRRIAGDRVVALNERLKKHGLIAVIAVRVIPVAPFPVVNAVAGAARIGFGQYVLGTVLGMAPGLTAMALFTQSFVTAMQQPSTGNIAVLAAVVAVIATGIYLLRRWLFAQS